MPGKFCVSLTAAKDNPDKATVAFVVANAAVASDKDTVVFLSTEGVRLAVKGYADDIAEEGFVLYKADFMTHESVRAVLLVLPALVALSAFGLMVSTLSDHTGIAASGCIGAYIFLEALKGSLANARHYLFNAYMPSLLDDSYFKALRGFADGLSDVAWQPEWFTLGIVTPLVSALLFASVAAWVFGRRDFLV